MKKLTVFLCVMMCAMTSWAQESDEVEEASEEPAMMANWIAAASPGPQHEMLASMAGKWDVEATFWMEPGGEPTMLTGKADRKMILDGRVLMEHYEGDFMGADFEGYGMTGYDNQTGTWWGSWSDTLSTSVSMSKGHCTENMETCTFMSEMLDPMSGETVYMKSVMKILGDDKELVEGYLIEPDGGEAKTMEIVYTRRK